MKFMEKLLDGVDVEWKALGEVGEFKYGYTAKAKDSGTARFIRISDISSKGELIKSEAKYVDISKDNEKYILQKNDLLMARTGATYGKTLFFNEDYPAIYAGFLIKLNFDKNRLNPRYYWHFAQSNLFWTQAKKLVAGGGQPQFNANVLKVVNIPIPCPGNPTKSLKIQAEIVRILDAFTSLTAELTAELTTRKKQYNYYRDRLLAFSEEDVELKSLDELAENLDSIRKPIKKGLREPGKIPYYGASGIVDYVKDYIFDGDFLLISEDGANLLARKTPIAFSISGKAWVNNHAHVLKFETYAERRFVEFYLNSIDLTPYISGAAQPKLNKKNLNNIKIPNPLPDKKKRIVAILDKFETLTNSISEGLPREIELRQKQYEYYRDLLLSFPESED